MVLIWSAVLEPIAAESAATALIRYLEGTTLADGTACHCDVVALWSMNIRTRDCFYETPCMSNMNLDVTSREDWCQLQRTCGELCYSCTTIVLPRTCSTFGAEDCKSCHEYAFGIHLVNNLHARETHMYRHTKSAKSHAQHLV